MPRSVEAAEHSELAPLYWLRRGYHPRDVIGTSGPERYDDGAIYEFRKKT